MGVKEKVLQTWNEVGKVVTDGIDSVCYALNAGIEVTKYPVLYSPKRLHTFSFVLTYSRAVGMPGILM